MRWKKEIISKKLGYHTFFFNNIILLLIHTFIIVLNMPVVQIDETLLCVVHFKCHSKQIGDLLIRKYVNNLNYTCDIII